MNRKQSIYRSLVSFLFLSFFILIGKGALIDEAKEALFNGQNLTGEELLERALKENPKLEKNSLYMLLAGRVAFLNYDFEEANDFFSKYDQAITKAKQKPDEILEIWERELEIAESAFDRVQKITVIDSISVPANRFLEAYRLSPSAGRLLNAGELPNVSSNKRVSQGYINEGKDYMILGVVDANGNSELMETSNLLGSGWQEPTPLPEEINGESGAAFPFMMSDGSTLYFAAEGENSMGGYDIFVAQRDPSTGEYLQPLNVGMPFNSPYNDFMMAIDEETGIGWWATDRNSQPGYLNIYVYQLSDVRRNYSPDDENLSDLAFLTDYRMTQDASKSNEYKEIMKSIASLGNEEQAPDPDFYFPVGNGKVYHHISDFRNREAAKKMTLYLEQ